MNKMSSEAIRQALEQAVHAGQQESGSPKARTRRRILEAAAEQFERFGYRRASMAEIAREAGVAKGTLYLYFESKSELMLGAIAHEKYQQLPRILSVFERDPADQLHAYVELIGTITRDMPLVTRLLQGDREIMAVLDDMHDDARAAMLDMGVAFLEEMVGAAAPHLSADTRRRRAIFLRSVAMTSAQLADDRMLHGLSIEDFAREMADVIAFGLTAPESSP